MRKERKEKREKKFDGRHVAIGIMTAVIFVSSVVFAASRGIKANAKELQELRGGIEREVAVSTSEYLGAYKCTNNDETVTLNKAVVECISGEVAAKASMAVSSPKVTSGTVSDINAVVSKAVDEKLREYGITSVSSRDVESMTTGVQALAISSTYKAISDRGLVDTETINVLRSALEDRMASIEKGIDGRLDSVSTTITEMQAVITSQNEVGMSDLNKKFEEQDSRLTVINSSFEKSNDELLKEISSLKAAQDNTANLVAVLDSQCADDKTELSNICSELSDSLEKSINQKSNALLSKINGLSDELDATNASLSLLGKNTEDKLGVINVSLKELGDTQAEELSKTSKDLEDKINSSSLELDSSIKTASDSLKVLIDGNSQDIDTLLTNLETAKSSLKEAYETADEEAKEELQGLINNLDTAITGLNSSFNNEIMLVRADMSSLTEEQSSALKSASEELNSKITSSNLDISSLKEASTALNGLVEGNTTNIASLTASLSTAKAELEKALEESGDESEEARKVLQDNIDAVDNVLSELRTDYGSRISVIEGNVKTLQDTIRSTADALSVTNETLQTTNQALEDVKGALEGQISDLQADTAANTSSISGLQTEVGEAEENIDALKEKIRLLEEELAKKAEFSFTYNEEGIPTINISGKAED